MTLSANDEEIVAAFQRFLRAVGGPPGETIKDVNAMLAALDVLDPEAAERISEKIATANDGA